MKMMLRGSTQLVVGMIWALFSAGASGCFRQDIRTLEIRVPGMKTTECAKIIQDGLNRVDGIISVEPDIQKRMITVKYNSTKVAIKNIEYVIVGLGFDANDEAGKPEAKSTLPADCR